MKNVEAVINGVRYGKVDAGNREFVLAALRAAMARFNKNNYDGDSDEEFARLLGLDMEAEAAFAKAYKESSAT